MARGNWIKNNPDDKIWWEDDDSVGSLCFSFDREKKYYLFQDYPYNMTAEEVALFDKENPYWAEFFKDRRQ